MQRIKRSALALVLDLAALVDPFDPAVRARIEASGHPTAEIAEAPLKDKLKRVEAAIEDARGERPALVEAVDTAKEKYAGVDDIKPGSDEFEEAKTAVGALGSHDDMIAELQAEQVGILKMLGKDQAPAGHDRAAGRGSDPRGDASWHSSVLENDEAIRAQLARASTSKNHVGPVELGEVRTRDALVTDITGSTTMRRGDTLGMVSQLRRALSVLDLIPTGTMTGNTLPYVQESGGFDTAAETTEGAAKGEGAATFTDKEPSAVTIAHWMKVRKQSLADFEALQSIIEGRLRYGVLRRLEKQILAGDGNAPNMLGILATSGIGAIAAADSLVADQILEAITSVLLANGQATGTVLHPTDWKFALKAKADGDGHYYSGGPFSVTPQQMWGVPLVSSAALTQGTGLVGDWEVGAQLFIREGVHVLLSDSDQDDFIKNRVTLLGEMRAALAVFQPAVFATVDLSLSES